MPRLVGLGPSFPDLFLGFLRAGSLGLGVSGEEVNSFSSKEFFCLSWDVMLVEDVADFSVGFGKRELPDYLPLKDYCSEWVDNFGRIRGGH